MKKIIMGILLVIGISIKVSGQCNIIKTRIDTDIAYIANAESIYKNEDLENGMLGAYFQLIAIQNGDNKDLLKFKCIVKIVSKRPKAPLAPRQITFIFEDNTQINIQADDIKLSQPMAGITQNQCNYSLSSSQFMKFQSTKIREVVINDTREYSSIKCTPHKGLIQEQANCITNKIE